MSKLDKIASQDAYDYGLALMFFGEGAGTRRKLITAAIDQKVQDIPGYAEKFNEAFSKLNQLEVAEKALAERKRLDRAAKAGKNLRALRLGKPQNLSSDLAAIFLIGYVAHMYGWDKKAAAESKKLWQKAKTEVKFQKARREGRNVEKF